MSEDPVPSSAAVSRQMRRQRERDVPRELVIRRALFREGYRYRVHAKVVPGTRREADLAFPGARVAVFLDGCFWHGCPEHGSVPKANNAWWATKLEDNRRRDRDSERRLADAGWTTVRVWEHEPVEAALARIASALPGPRRSAREPSPPA